MSEVRRQVPGLRMLAEYKAGWLPHDVVAGLVLTTLLVPQGVAYAELAGPARHHRPLHVDHVPARLRGVRAVAGARARAGLLARADDRRGHPADRGRPRRPGAGDRARLDARPARRRDHVAGGHRPPGVHRRPPLEADHDRLHERAGRDDPDRPDTEAVRALYG